MNVIGKKFVWLGDCIVWSMVSLSPSCLVVAGCLTVVCMYFTHRDLKFSRKQRSRSWLLPWPVVSLVRRFVSLGRNALNVVGFGAHRMCICMFVSLGRVLGRVEVVQGKDERKVELQGPLR